MLGNTTLMNKPVGRLLDSEWGWIVAAVIFGWVKVRAEQAAVEGLNDEETVIDTALTPNPCDVGKIHAMLPKLAETAAVDWSLPLSAWSKDVMTSFLLLAQQLMDKAEVARGKVVSRKRPAFKDVISEEAKEGDGPFVQKVASS